MECEQFFFFVAHFEDCLGLDVRPPPQHLPPCVLKPSVKLSGCAEILGRGEGFACF